MSAWKEGSVGCLIFGGVGVAVLGLIMTLVLYFGGAARFGISQATDVSVYVMRGLGPATFLVGCAMLLGGLVWGIRESRAEFRPSGKPVHHPGVRVMARYAYEADGNQVMDPDRFGDDDVQLFVKLYHPNGRAVEYRTMLPVWSECGEGMVGEAITDGKWLAGFRPVRIS